MLLLAAMTVQGSIRKMYNISKQMYYKAPRLLFFYFGVEVQMNQLEAFVIGTIFSQFILNKSIVMHGAWNLQVRLSFVPVDRGEEIY